MWREHPFSQRNTTTERAVGVGDVGNREEGWRKFENIGGSS